MLACCTFQLSLAELNSLPSPNQVFPVFLSFTSMERIEFGRLMSDFILFLAK